MRKLVSLLVLFAVMPCFADARIDAAIENVRATCGGISDELSDMKKMAGINTAVTGVATVAGGVALGIGIAKTGVDKEAEEIENLLNRLKELEKAQVVDVPVKLFFEGPVQGGHSVAREIAFGGKKNSDEKQQLEKELEEKTKKSKTLGDVRTGTMAAAAVANVAGAVISSNNRVKGDLKNQIEQCISAVHELSGARMQAHVSKTLTEPEMAYIDEVIRACSEWESVRDIDSINNKSTGATVSSGVGAGLGLVGTITSAIANSDSVRDDNSDSGKKKEKNLNTASNVLAGGTTVASGVATVFNATQIKVIKRVATVADACEGVLRK